MLKIGRKRPAATGNQGAVANLVEHGHDVVSSESAVDVEPPPSSSKAVVSHQQTTDAWLDEQPVANKPADTRVARLPQRMLSVKEVATFLGTCEKTIQRKILSGELRAYKIGLRWAIAPADLEAFLATRANWQRVYVP